MTSSNKSLALAVSGAFLMAVGTTSLAADENPFAIKSLSHGYQVADAGSKMKDGKCSTGKCGANKKKTAATEEKMKDGKCSAEKAAEGNCSAEMKAKAADSTDKAKEAACSADMKKAKEGNCSADKK